MNNTNKKTNRKESDDEYAIMMKNYMEEKYSKTFEVVEYSFPEGGFNTGMKQNIVTLKDDKGIACNVMANLSTPYKYYDDYFESYAASLIEEDLKSDLFASNNARIYVTVKNENVQAVDVSPDNISSLTFVCGIHRQPEQDDVQKLYDIYKQIEGKGFADFYFIVGFVNDSKDFDNAISNYRVLGKSKWSDYQGTFYAYLTVKAPGLSYDEFESSIVKQ